MVKRRTFLTVGAGLLGAGLLARPRAVGGPHTAYHQALGQTLRRAGVDRPVLVVDLDRLDHNVDLVMRSVAVSRSSGRREAESRARWQARMAASLANSR